MSATQHETNVTDATAVGMTRLFALDTRSLAAFRIGLGVILLVGLYYRLPDLAAHYSDEGALPRAARMT